jgi:hypothetical protein
LIALLLQGESMPKENCPICDELFEYKTKKPESCDDCDHFLVRAKKKFGDAENGGHKVSFDNPTKFAKKIRKLFYFEQEELCKLSKLKMFKKTRNKPLPIDKTTYYFLKFSIDRINSDGPYGEDNIELTTYICNVMKNKLETPDLVRFCTYILGNLLKNGDETSQYLIESFSTRVIELLNEGSRGYTQAEIEKFIKEFFEKEAETSTLPEVITINDGITQIQENTKKEIIKRMKENGADNCTIKKLTGINPEDYI